MELLKRHLAALAGLVLAAVIVILNFVMGCDVIRICAKMLELLSVERTDDLIVALSLVIVGWWIDDRRNTSQLEGV